MSSENNLNPVRSKTEARELGRRGGIKSGKVRKERALLRKLGYTSIESFDKLNELQSEAIAMRNINAALKAEELKGKLAGLYVEKVAQTKTDGSDIPVNDLSKVPINVLLQMAERVGEKIDV